MTIDDTIASQLTRLSDALDDQISALAEKGVTATGHGEEDIGDDIRSIEQPFIVTLSWDNQELKWLPDCTIGDIRGAYAAGRDIAVVADSNAVPNYVQVNGYYYYSTGDYFYIVAETDTLANIETKTEYQFNNLGVSEISVITTYFANDLDADPAEVPSGAKFVTDTGYETGTATRRSSSDLSVNGDTVTAPAGYYASSASESVASGTEGTPSASKGAVSNHAVDVTPSVTNSEGYINGGTHTGTPVSVDASELVSGTKQISANGTDIDVTNFQKVDVAVPGGGDNVFLVTLSWDSQENMYMPDCTYAQAYAAYQAGKTVAFECGEDDGYAPYCGVYSEVDSCFVYSVLKNYYSASPSSHWGYQIYTYFWTSEGVELDDNQIIYSMDGANAIAADVTAGKYFFNANGLQVGTNQGGGGSSKEKYIYDGLASRTANSYGATSAKVTVTKAGTYNISYVAIRGSSSGTMGTNLHIGSTQGTNQQTWNNGTYGQYVHLTNQQISANTDVTIYATSGSTSRTIYVGMLIVEEV